MAYNTGNPIGSADVRDLYDNAQNLDKAMNSTDPTWIDRFGVARPTFKGAESELNQKVGDAEAAATQALGYLNTMRATSYGPLAEDPTTDPLGNPCTAGDEYFNTTYNLLKRYDGTNWRVPDINTENLASGAGSSMVGHGGQTVEAALNERLPEIGNYALLRAYTGQVTAFYVRGVANVFDGGFGVFRVDAADTTTADNGGTIIVDALGRRWKREYSGAVNITWFGAKGDWNGIDGTDNTASISAAIVFASAIGTGNILVPAGKYRVFDGMIPLASGVYIHGEGIGVTEIIFDRETSETSTNRYVFTGTLIENFGFSDLTLRANTTYSSGIGALSNTGTVHGVLLDKVKNLIVERVEVRDFNHNGFLVRNSQTTGYEDYYSDNIVFSGCRFIHNRATGLRIESAKNVRISNCYTENNGVPEDAGSGYGMVIGGLTGDWNGLGVKFAIVEHCIFRNENNIGLDGHNIVDVIVANNMFIDCRRKSCAVYNSENPPLDATYGSAIISGNTFKHTKEQSWSGYTGTTSVNACFIGVFSGQELPNYLFKNVSICDNVFEDFNVSNTTIDVVSLGVAILAKAGEQLTFSNNIYNSKYFANALPTRVAYLHGGASTKFIGNAITIDTPSVPADPADRIRGLIQLLNINEGSVIANNSFRNKSVSTEYLLRIVNQDGTPSYGAAVFSGNSFDLNTTTPNIFHPIGSSARHFAIFQGNTLVDRPLGSAISSITIPQDLAYRSTVISSEGSGANASRSTVISSLNSLTSGFTTTVLSSAGSEDAGGASMICASSNVKNTATYVVTGGYSSSGSASTANRKWEIDSRTGNIKLAGTLTQSSTFTDFAEYFENSSKGVIPLGTIVTIDDGKVRKATENDEILGVVSATAGIALGDASFAWQGRYLVGEFGEPIYEDVLDPNWKPSESETESYRPYIRVPVENSEYRQELDYKPRSERPEDWTLVGLIGQVYVRVLKTVTAGKYVSASGDVSDSQTRLLCMRVVSEYSDEKGYAVAKCLVR